MLLTTSRRPCHQARILGRELARFLPGGEYVPRGVRTIEKIVSLARQRGHDRVVVINSLLDRPGEIRFIEVGETWRWMDASIKLAVVAINRAKVRADDFGRIKIFAGDAASLEFARWLGEILEIEHVERLPESGPVILVTFEDGLKIKFELLPGGVLGPVLSVASFGSLFGVGDEGGPG